MEALSNLREHQLRLMCETVRHERHEANEVLYYPDDIGTCWYIFLSGSVFIKESMFLPRSSFGKRSAGSFRRGCECIVLEPSEMIVAVHSLQQKSWNTYPIVSTITSLFSRLFRSCFQINKAGLSCSYIPENNIWVTSSGNSSLMDPSSLSKGIQSKWRLLHFPVSYSTASVIQDICASRGNLPLEASSLLKQALDAARLLSGRLWTANS
ncbi:uncharacterized protein LOC135268135 isoform X2 [Aotus nancymaae]